MSEERPPAPGGRPGGRSGRSRRRGAGRSSTGGGAPTAGATPGSGQGGNTRAGTPGRSAGGAPPGAGPAAASGQPGGQREGSGRSRRRGRGGSGNRGRGPAPAPPPSRDSELGDEPLRERLLEAGFDLEEVHELAAFLYFSNENTARRSLPQLEAAGYATYPAPTGEGRWVVEAVIRAAPTTDHLAAMRAQLRGITQPLGGLYDGWSATAIDEEAEAEQARVDGEARIAEEARVVEEAAIFEGVGQVDPGPPPPPAPGPEPEPDAPGAPGDPPPPGLEPNPGAHPARAGEPGPAPTPT